MRVSMVTSLFAGWVAVAISGTASAQTSGEAPRDTGRFSDPTGGAYTPPTSLFIPAAALPALMPRLTVGADVQPAGSLSALRPFLNAELGLGARFTLAAGTQWFGGDPSNAADALTPFGQVRFQLFGRPDGMGPIGGVSLTYKRVGYRGGENEVEAAFSFHYRLRRVEFGVQGTFGQSLQDGGEHDIEARAFAAVRPIPSLALGLSGQVRGDIGDEGSATEAARRAAGRSDFDFLGGATASYTFSRWQVGALVGGTTLGLYEQIAFLAQAQGQVRF